MAALMNSAEITFHGKSCNIQGPRFCLLSNNTHGQDERRETYGIAEAAFADTILRTNLEPISVKRKQGSEPKTLDILRKNKISLKLDWIT